MKLEIYIAGLALSLNSIKNQEISLPICHNAFIQPVATAQAGVIFSGGGNRLILSFRESNLVIDQKTQLCYSSESWELGRSMTGEWVFTTKSEDPPYCIKISADFTHGSVIRKNSIQAGILVYPIELLEIRLFSAWLAIFGDLLLHASGVALDGKGYCFVGDSGAGKSTLAAALAANPAVTVLGEDQVILRYLDGQFWIFGTPWHTDPKMCSPLGVPLEKMYFLDRTLPPGARALKPALGVTNLLRTAFVPYYMQEYLPGILDRLSLLAERVPFYSLSYHLGSDPLALLK